MNSGTVLAIDHHDIKGAANARDRRYFPDEIEIELLIERRVHRVRYTDQQEADTPRWWPRSARA